MADPAPLPFWRVLAGSADVDATRTVSSGIAPRSHGTEGLVTRGSLCRAGVGHLGLKTGLLGLVSALLSLGTDGAVPKSPGSPKVPGSKWFNAQLGLCLHCPGDPGAGSLSPKETEGPQPSQPSCPHPSAAGGGQSWVRWDEMVLTLQAARCHHALPAATRCPHPREGKSSEAGTERNVALGCLCAFCLLVTFVNQVINRIRTALLPCLSVIGQGRSGAARQREPQSALPGGQAAESPRGGRGRCPVGCWQWAVRVQEPGACCVCVGELALFLRHPYRSVQARAHCTQGQGPALQPALHPIGGCFSWP